MKNGNKLITLILLFSLFFEQNVLAQNLTSVVVDSTYEIRESSNDSESKDDTDPGDSGIFQNSESLININNFNSEIHNKVLSYINGDIKLTKLKRDFKKNIQYRKKYHKELLETYNNNLKDGKYIKQLSVSSLGIDNTVKLKKIIFSN